MPTCISSGLCRCLFFGTYRRWPTNESSNWKVRAESRAPPRGLVEAMSVERIRIGIVLATDFQGRDGGGAQPTIKIFLKHAQERPFEIFLLGMSSTKDEVVGQLSKRVIYGREYPFIPLFYHDTE